MATEPRSQGNRLFAKAFALIWMATLLLTATAAAADRHFQESDKNCVLCQLRTNTQGIQTTSVEVPEPSRADWLVPTESPVRLRQFDLLPAASRGPPLTLLSFS